MIVDKSSIVVQVRKRVIQEDMDLLTNLHMFDYFIQSTNISIKELGNPETGRL